MSTRVYQSAEIKENIEKVWKVLREFDFPSKVFSFIESCSIEGNGSTSVGAIRKLKWKSGESRVQRLLELSDYKYTITYELIESSPSTEVSAYITTIKLYRNTQTDTTLVAWEADFSSDVRSDYIQFEQKAFALNLQDLQKFFNK